MNLNLLIFIFGGVVAALFCSITGTSGSDLFTSEELSLNEQLYDVDVAVAFDDRWLGQSGSHVDAVSKLLVITQYVERHFNSSTYHFKWRGFLKTNNPLTVDSTGINNAKQLAVDSSLDASIYIFMTAHPSGQSDGQNLKYGIAAGTGTVCQEAARRNRVVLTAWKTNDTETAKVIAQTIETLLGGDPDKRQCLICKNTGRPDWQCDQLLDSNSECGGTRQSTKELCERTCGLCGQ